jgi:hypothetical protein
MVLAVWMSLGAKAIFASRHFDGAHLQKKWDPWPAPYMVFLPACAGMVQVTGFDVPLS